MENIIRKGQAPVPRAGSAKMEVVVNGVKSSGFPPDQPSGSVRLRITYSYEADSEEAEGPPPSRWNWPCCTMTACPS